MNVSLPAFVRSLVVAVTMLPQAKALASVAFTEHYDNLSVDSKVTVSFDLNRTGRFDGFNLTTRLYGRVDASIVLSSPGPLPVPVLEAFRVKRITLRTDPLLEGSALGFTGSIQDFAIHLGDGIGSAGPYSDLFGLSGWNQPAPNLPGFTGTARVTGPLGLDELLDCSQLEQPNVALTGQCEILDAGTRTRFSLSMDRYEVLKTVPPMQVHFTISLSQTKPLVIPAPSTTFAAWVAVHGLTGGAAAPAADPDGDTRSNILEYALDSDPRVPDSAEPPVQAVMAGGMPAFQLNRRDDRTDLAWHVQLSNDLQQWKTLASSTGDSDTAGVSGGIVLEEVTTGPGTWRAVIRDPSFTAPATKRYARLMLELK